MISPSQSASILARHATEIASLRLLELCHDEDRVDSMVEVLNGEDGRSLLVDFSRQRMVRVLKMEFHYIIFRICNIAMVVLDMLIDTGHCYALTSFGSSTTPARTYQGPGPRSSRSTIQPFIE